MASQGPVSRRFRKVFGPGKPQQKSQTLRFQSCSFHTILMRTKLTFMPSLMPTHCFLFEIQIIKNGFTGPISYPVFRETGPRPEKFSGLFEKRAPGARFWKVPKSFRARKATTKISNLKFTELFFSRIFNMNKFSLHAKFHAYTLCV